MEATITSKGQITLPKALRDEMHLKAGDKILFEDNGEGGFAIIPRLHDVRMLKGMIKYTGKPLSVEDMNKAAAQHVASNTK